MRKSLCYDVGMPPLITLHDQTFGRWTVTGYAGQDARKEALWAVVCVCGSEGTVPGHRLRAGASLSCGCLQKDRTSAANKKHGYFGTRTYDSWAGMLSRCRSPTNPGYARYGGEGVKVCPRWAKFEHFLEDMGERPEGEYTLDRLDNTKGYEPGNCRWATKKEQAENRGNVLWYDHEGKSLTAAGWAKELGLSNTSVHRRLKNGETVAQILAHPRKPRV